MYIKKYLMLYNMCVLFIGFVNNVCVCVLHGHPKQ